MVMIIWMLKIQLPIQSVSITTNIVSLNPAHGEVYSIQHYEIKLVSDFLSKAFLLVLANIQNVLILH